ncbi:MAG: hypothetical protein ABRQ37_23170, partial [Candidatus Eremiobacterota bacterium]
LIEEAIKVDAKISCEITDITIPAAWTCTVITDDLEKAERPHGLHAPIAITEFTNKTVEINGHNKKINPSLNLYFYDISEKEKIKGIIKKEALYSWNIPVYFDETKNFIIITSPSYINNGIFTEEAKKYYSPLEKSLKEYFRKVREEK